MILDEFVDIPFGAELFTDGTSATVVHYPGYSNLSDGQRITVLVDPKQPDYAELPGDTFVGAWSWIIFVLLGIGCGSLAYLDARQLRVLLAHRRIPPV